MFPIKDSVPSSRVPWVMWVLIAANLAIFAWMLRLYLAGSPELVEGMVMRWGVVPVAFTDPAARSDGVVWQYATLVTSMFLHGGILHVVLNVWSLWIFGDNVEDQMGHGRFILFYLATGVAAGLVHVVAYPDSTMPVVGASGAISGVMGAYLLLFPMARVLVVIPIIIIPLFFSVPAFVFIGIWFLLQFLSGTIALQQAEVGGVAFWAHIGGFVAGMALCPFLATKPAKGAEGTR